MRFFVAAFVSALLWFSPLAQAQDTGTVVATCPATNLNYAVGSVRPITIDQNGNLCLGPIGGGAASAAGYPAGATPFATNNSGTTGAVAATIPGVANKFTYICGYYVASAATAATSGTATIIGAGNNLAFVEAVAALPAVAVAQQTFTPCIPGVTIATNITVNAIAAGTGGTTTIYLWGFNL